MITILSVDHTRENFTIVEYKNDGVYTEACIFHAAENVKGGLKRVAADDPVYDEITRAEADILLAEADEFEKTNMRVHPVFEEALSPFTAFDCPQCGGKMYYNHCTPCDRRGL